MGIIKIDVEQAEIPKRQHSQFMRDSNREVMTRHRDKRLGKHYKNIPETQPGGDYGYTKRGEKYLKKKRRKKGHDRPLEYTGHMKRTVRNNSRITATQTRARFVAKNYYKMTDQRRKEIEAISTEEQREIADETGVAYWQKASRAMFERKKKKSIK
ncbi:hypothetical protein GYB59_00555 [bacterium]|nr:hypothetical protein [bacterium]